MDKLRLWQVLWNDEAHFHLNEIANTHNYCIWDMKSSRTFQKISFHLLIAVVRFAFKAAFILGTFIFEKEIAQWLFDGQEVSKHG